ncbi:MAG: proteasome assembly chaperone family protein [Nanoarchaeota archaeon]|nr:proteasome assembly chaperone family protein [Nanoarchaeota archaeon]
MKVRDRVHIVLDTKRKILSPTFIIGFQGVGLVGTMASQHLADKLKCELIGHVESEFMPPIAILHENSLTFPIRIYYCKKHNLIIITSEVPLSSDLAFEVSDDITELMKKFKSKMAYVLEGLITKDEEPDQKKISGVPSNEKVRKFLEKNKLEIIENGAILGIAGSMLLATVEKKIDSCALMAESHINIPDAMASSTVIKTLGQILGFSVDTSELDKKGADIEKKIKSITETMRKYKLGKGSDEEANKALYG